MSTTTLNRNFRFAELKDVALSSSSGNRPLVLDAGTVTDLDPYEFIPPIPDPTAGNFPQENSDGTLSDSGYDPTDFATSTHNHDTAYVNVSGDTMTGGLLINVDATEAFKVEQKGVFDDLFVVDTDTPSVRAGGTSDYTQFDRTGHQTMVGGAKPWTDLRIEPVARTIGTNAPTFEKYYDDVAGTSRGVYLYSFDDAAANAEKEIFFTMQMPHEWDLGEVHIHVHWVPSVADTTATPRWGLEYVWKAPGEVFGDTHTIYAVGNEQGEADLIANKHYITEFSPTTPDGTQTALSSILIGRLFRNSSDAADTYNFGGNKCGLLYIDAHFQLNSLGSTEEYTK